MKHKTQRYIGFFFFNDTAPTEIYALSLHDALPISPEPAAARRACLRLGSHGCWRPARRDRKSTRLNSSHGSTSNAVFCLKKKMIQWLAENDPEETFEKDRNRCERELLHYLTGVTGKIERKKIR